MLSGLVYFCSLVAAQAQTVSAGGGNVLVDNEYVRVIRAVDEPHKKHPLHNHDLNRVMVYLTAGDLDVTHEGGKVEHQHWKAEQVAWSAGSKTRHTSENVGDKPLVIIELEMKNKPKPGFQRDPKMDPVLTDAKHNSLLFENDQVRVTRNWREAGGSETLHEHTGVGRVVVLLTDINAKVKMANGGTGELVDTAGGVHWSAGSTAHIGTNAGAKRFDMILVEVK